MATSVSGLNPKNPILAAVTPGYHALDIPDFSEIKFDIKFKFPESFWNARFDNHPINWKPLIKISKKNIDNFINTLKNF